MLNLVQTIKSLALPEKEKMEIQQKQLFDDRTSALVLFVAAIASYLIQQIGPWNALFSSLQVLGNDDAMRMVQVRDLLAGQNWFDEHQYRLLPPDGVAMHWSRYIDAPLAAINIVLRPFVGAELAEKWAATIWPVFLFLAYVTLIARTTKSAFGQSAACFAVLVACLTPRFTRNYFAVSRVDHHNVQVLLMFGIFALLINERHTFAKGLMMGILAALSLSVGLETIFFIFLTGLILTVQYVVDPKDTKGQLMGFGTAMGVTSPILFLGQTAVPSYTEIRCDELSLPYLAMTSVAAIFCVVVPFFSGRKTVPTRSMIATLSAIVLGMGIWPLLSKCAHGPYTELTPEVMDRVLASIIEYASFPRVLSASPSKAIELFFPLYATTALVIIVLIVWRHVKSNSASNKLQIVCAFLLLGSLGTLSSGRYAILGYSVLPLAAGVTIAAMANEPWIRPHWLRASLTTFFAIGILLPFLFSGNVLSFPSANTTGLSNTVDADIRTTPKFSAVDSSCEPANSLMGLSKIPKAVILNPINLGPRILLLTDHSITSAPYHRSLDAMWNGTFPFYGEDENMKLAFERSGADFVVVCGNQQYGNPESVGSKIARGDFPTWLEPVDIGNSPLVVARVLTHKD